MTLTKPGKNDGKVTAFVKHSENGRLWKLGAEELFLLTELDRGQDPAVIASDFQKQFGKSVKSSVVTGFARQMLGAGVLKQVAETDVPPSPAAKTPKPAATDEDTPEESRESDDDMAQLEDLVFNEDPTGDAPKDAEAKAKKPKGPKPDGAPKTRLFGGGKKAAAPSGLADPSIANRDVKFERGGFSADEPLKMPGLLHLFDPSALLRGLNGVFGFWSYVSWLLYPLVLFAILVVLQRPLEFMLGLAESRELFSRIGFLVISFFTVNLFTTLVTGVVAHRQGAEIKSFGLIFLLFVLPRFAIDQLSVYRLEKQGKLAFFAAGLKARLFLFGFSTVIWVVMRQSGTIIPDLAVAISLISAFSFLLMALPLLQGDGYRWLSTYYDQPMLRQRSFAYLLGQSEKMNEHFGVPTRAEKWAFASYGLGAVLVTGMIAGLLLVVVTRALEGRFGGTGVVMLAVLIAVALTWMAVMKRNQKAAGEALVKAEIADKIAEHQAARGRSESTELVPVDRPRGQLIPQGQRTGTAIARPAATAVGMPRQGGGRQLSGVYADDAPVAPTRWFLRLIAVGALTAFCYAAFLPYSYDVGGDFTILPDARSSVSARVAGELIEINVAEGEVVEAGQVLARLSEAQPRLMVATAEADLASARNRLQQLLDGPPEEDVQVAREQVRTAELALPFAEGQAERAENLLSRGAISTAEAERFQRAFIEAQQALNSANANLESVLAPATASEIAIAEAEIERINAQLEFAQLALESVEIRAPVAGRVVTENVALILGTFLDVGDLFVEIEDHKIARAEVSVSETDIGLVKVGDTVRLKAWATSEEERTGQVIALAPLAEDLDLGRVVRVKTQFENTGGFYRPGMTGFAKIDGAEMPAWQAFTRLFDRFFRIEVWGWIP
ncbi:HlyD family secretion protein [Actibacterium mucosum]|uniref:HlyD family secretion protein n=1 Tax=Actibacterium mucosum TaxID=1087332 RepID=UPI0013789712|nr:efflux RND transporter periplasmic adaptor subunit [Actibacterium mucosum]